MPLRLAKGFRVTTSGIPPLCAASRRAETEVLFDCVLYPLGKLGQVFFSAAEDDVAALDVCLRVFQFQRDTERLERVHFDHVAAANVHAAEHADDDWHKLP